ERNLNAFIPDQTAERFLSTGYAPMKRPSAQVLRKGGLIMGQTKNNGAEPQPDRKILRLSDLYTVRMKETQLELTAVLLNINRNHNRELMEACRDLKDYAEYVDRVRKYARELPLSEAVECAITECIREGILKEFLEKNRAEVKKMSIYEYDQEKHIRMERQEAWEDGMQEGRREGIKEGELRGRNAQLSELIKKKL